MLIRARIITLVTLAILLIVGTATAVVLRIQKRQIIAAAKENTVMFSDIIVRAVHTSMAKADFPGVQNNLENIGKSREIKELRIIAPDGTITKSTHPSEVGTKSIEFLKAPSAGQQEDPVLLGTSTVNYFRQIPNSSECHGCHSASEPVIGLVQVKLDVSRQLALIDSAKRVLIAFGLIIIVSVPVILGLMLNQFIMTPLQGLINTIRDVESGNWKAKAAELGNDELGRISSAFNRMIDKINDLYTANIAREREIIKFRTSLEHTAALEEMNEQLQFKILELESANRAISALSHEVKSKNISMQDAINRLEKLDSISKVFGSIHNPAELYRSIVRTAADLLASDEACVHVKDGYAPSLTLRYRRGFGIDNIRSLAPRIEEEYADLLLYGTPFPSTKANPNGAVKNHLPSRVAFPLKVRGKIIGMILASGKMNSGDFSEEDRNALATFASQAVVGIENAMLYETVKSNYFATIQSLVNALEANDRFTKGHSERVRILSIELARYIGLDLTEVEVLEHASILHDIGKIGIDSIILQKQGKLTPKEYEMIKLHPITAEAILSPITTLSGVRQTILQHHERYDGKGYPYGLRGEELSLKSRILSVVDTFDAMMSERPYRDSLQLSSIKHELRCNAGTQFDPYVVDAFIELLEKPGHAVLAAAGYEMPHGTA